MIQAGAWAATVPAVLCAIALLWLPGLLVLAPLRLAPVARTALAAVLSVACLGIAGIVFGATGLPFAAWQVLVPAVGAVAVAAPLRHRLQGRGRSVRQAPGWAVPITWAVSTVGIAVVAFAAVPDPARISQTYDNVFHLTAVAHILADGDASSLTLRTLIETERTWSFYPAGWHSLVAATVQLSGASVPVAANAAWIAVCAALWLPGVAWLSQVLLRSRDPRRVALVALPLGAAFGAMPYALLTWGTLYPTFLATALVPAAVAAPVSAWRRLGRASSSQGATVALGLAATAAAGFALCVSQPRVLVTWALLLGPFIVAELVRLYLRARREGGVRRRRARAVFVAVLVLLVVALGMAFAFLVLRMGLFERPLEDRLGGPQARATQTVLEGLGQVLLQSWPVGVADADTFPAVFLAVAVLGGLVVAARTRGLRWVVVAYALVAVLFALAAGSDDVFAKLVTALWYKDRFRLSSAIPVLGIPLAALGMFALGDLLRRRALGPRTPEPAVAWIIAAVSALGLAPLTAAAGEVFRLPARGAGSEVVSQAQIDFASRIAEVVPAGQRVVGDPWDGSALTRVFGGPEAVFPHVNGQWDPARLVLAQRLQDIDTDPAVCAALNDLDVRYVVYHPHEFGGGDPAGNHFSGVHAAVEAGLFTPVLTDGDSTLYRIDRCDAED